MANPIGVVKGALVETLSLTCATGRWLTGLGPATERVTETLYPHDARIPVVLVHGLCANKSYWHPLENHLVSLGHPVLSVNYSWTSTTIAQCGAQVAADVDTLLQRLGGERVHLIGHSLGGVVIKWAIHHTTLGSHAARVVSLGSPHQGAPLAALPGAGLVPLLGGIIGQIAPGSPALAEQQIPLPAGISWTTVGGGTDPLVPAHRAALPVPAGEHHVFENLGHISMVTDRRVIGVVTAAVTGPAQRPALTLARGTSAS